MAENLSIKKSPIECVLECPLCLHQLTLPQTLQQCLHSYCKSCLDKVPQKNQDGRQGWLCPMCDIFTKCDQIQQNTFIEELQKIHTETENCDKVMCEQCFDDSGEATWKCLECKIALCEIGKAVHLKIPMLKGHTILPLDSDREKVIDNIVFCKVHPDIPTHLNCLDCAQLICYKCNITEHEHHKAETVEQALERILPETESSAKLVNENIGIMQAQIEGVKKEIEQTKELYSCCRIQMDNHLEKVICRMRALKVQMEEDVNEQESIALDTLKELKQQLEKQLSQARLISNLTAVVTTKTKNTSQLQQLQAGLFEKVKAIGASKKEGLYFQLSAAKFIEGHQIKELENIFGGLSLYFNDNNISANGEIWIDKDNFMCHEFIKSFEIDTGIEWCNRLSYVDNKCLCLPVGWESQIKFYNTEGKLVNTVDTVEKEISVVREACNGDLICGGDTGLYIANKAFTEWTLLAEGQFSDVFVHQERFFALDYENELIDQYSLSVDGQWQSMLIHKLVTDKPKELNLDENSTLCFSNSHFWLTSSVNEELYKFSNSGNFLHVWEETNISQNICRVDKKDKTLIADYIGGKLYLLDTKQQHDIPINEICQSVTVEELRDVVIDYNHSLWTVSGARSKGMKLIKFTQNRQHSRHIDS